MTLHIGSLDASGRPTAASMAGAIYDSLLSQVPLGANEDPHGRGKIALAIAQGVIQYLAANHDAVHVTVRNNYGHGTHEQSITIDYD